MMVDQKHQLDFTIAGWKKDCPSTELAVRKYLIVPPEE